MGSMVPWFYFMGWTATNEANPREQHHNSIWLPTSMTRSGGMRK